eukprot:600863-Rhodomonas_salina.3
MPTLSNLHAPSPALIPASIPPAAPLLSSRPRSSCSSHILFLFPVRFSAGSYSGTGSAGLGRWPLAPGRSSSQAAPQTSVPSAPALQPPPARRRKKWRRSGCGRAGRGRAHSRARASTAAARGSLLRGPTRPAGAGSRRRWRGRRLCAQAHARSSPAGQSVLSPPPTPDSSSLPCPESPPRVFRQRSDIAERACIHTERAALVVVGSVVVSSVGQCRHTQRFRDSVHSRCVGGAAYLDLDEVLSSNLRAAHPTSAPDNAARWHVAAGLCNARSRSSHVESKTLQRANEERVEEGGRYRHDSLSKVFVLVPVDPEPANYEREVQAGFPVLVLPHPTSAQLRIYMGLTRHMLYI